MDGGRNDGEAGSKERHPHVFGKAPLVFLEAIFEVVSLQSEVGAELRADSREHVYCLSINN
jgi:hypothetical protein